MANIHLVQLQNGNPIRFVSVALSLEKSQDTRIPRVHWSLVIVIQLAMLTKEVLDDCKSLVIDGVVVIDSKFGFFSAGQSFLISVTRSEKRGPAARSI